MRFTDRTDHALRALMFLAASGKRHTVAEMARGFAVPANHLTKSVQRLERRGWVSTVPGRGGGVELSIDAGRLRVGDVVREIEPSLDLVECHRADGRCPMHGPCRLAGVLDGLRVILLEALDRVTLDDLVRGREPRLVQVVVRGKHTGGKSA